MQVAKRHFPEALTTLLSTMLRSLEMGLFKKEIVVGMHREAVHLCVRLKKKQQATSCTLIKLSGAFQFLTLVPDVRRV